MDKKGLGQFCTAMFHLKSKTLITNIHVCWKSIVFDVPFFNLKVTCGKDSRRKKRSTMEQLRNRRAVSGYYVRVTFEIVVEYDEGTKTPQDAYAVSFFFLVFPFSSLFFPPADDFSVLLCSPFLQFSLFYYLTNFYT